MPERECESVICPICPGQNLQHDTLPHSLLCGRYTARLPYSLRAVLGVPTQQLCIWLFVVLLFPGLAHATLESPAQGAVVSGLGFISGWKCDAGTITVRLNDGGPLTVATGQPRVDTRLICGTVHNGFITQVNWNHLGEGTHTAVAYDDGVEFARHTFTVGSTGEEFLSGVTVTVDVPDFPAPGETGRFVWNESTQHLELSEVREGTQTPTGTIPVHCLVHRNESVIWHTPEGIQSCLSAGADPNIQDPRSGATPLHVVSGEYDMGVGQNFHRECLACVKLLLAGGANPDIRDNEGQTPVHVASWDDDDVQVPILRALLEAGADPNVRTADGRTPLDMARQFGTPEQVQLLRDFGAY